MLFFKFWSLDHKDLLGVILNIIDFISFCGWLIKIVTIIFFLDICLDYVSGVEVLKLRLKFFMKALSFRF